MYLTFELRGKFCFAELDNFGEILNDERQIGKLGCDCKADVPLASTDLANFSFA